MSTLPDTPTQILNISSELNALLLGMFLMGMYTVVYFGTVYVWFTVKISQSKVVLWAISLLYICGIVECSFNWVFLQWIFITNGETRETVFASLNQLPRWVHVMNNVFALAMLVLADGLLIWRCFNVWGRSWRVIMFPLFLYAVHVCLFLSAIIMLFVLKARPKRFQALIVDKIESAAYSLSAVTSLTATILIAYRIWSLSTSDGRSESWGRFRHIIEILVQSAVVYSAVLVVQAAGLVLPLTIGARAFPLSIYAVALCTPIAGIAPTIMVARVNLSAVNSTWSTTHARKPASTLRFPTHRTSTSLNGTTRVISECDTAERT